MEEDKLFIFIKKIFYNEIVPECSNKSLKIKDFSPTLFFKTSINKNYKISSDETVEPILMIDNKDEFDIALYEYTKEAIKFYGNSKITHDNLKYVMSLIFANAGYCDLANPVYYLKHRLNLLRNNIEDDLEITFLGYDSKIEIEKQNIGLEAPFSFKVSIFEDNDYYTLPEIIFGIDDSCAYIYAIQNKFRKTNKLSKKVKRILYKFNSNFNDDTKEEVLNATDVTMSFIASIVIFIKYLNSINIDKIILKTNMPLRYNSHYESYNRRFKHFKEIYSYTDYGNIKYLYDTKNKLYDDNIFMKIVRTFYRISKQGDVIDLDYSSFNINSDINIFINKEGKFNNDLYNDIYLDSNIKK